jgi:hypothetical protein
MPTSKKKKKNQAAASTQKINSEDAKTTRKLQEDWGTIREKWPQRGHS